MSAVRVASRETPLDAELDASVPVQGNTLTMEDLRDVPATLCADLGQCDIYVRDILMLERGSVLALDKIAGEMADVLVNGVPIARGEIVVLGDSLNVRIAEIFGLTEREPVEP
jgi:flagellar motor switch protein FliN/FliY